MKSTFTLVFVLLFVCQLQAQKITIKGEVTEEYGEILPFANVFIKGKSGGTITNESGKYQLNAEVGDIIIASYIGYESVEIKVNETTNNIDITMENKGYDLKIIEVRGYESEKISYRTRCGIYQTQIVEVGEEEENNEENLITWKYYPNPTRHQVRVETQNKVGFIALYDLNGRLLVKKEIKNDVLEMNMERYAVSTYFLRYETEEGKKESIGQVVLVK